MGWNSIILPLNDSHGYCISIGKQLVIDRYEIVWIAIAMYAYMCDASRMIPCVLKAWRESNDHARVYIFTWLTKHT